MKNNNNNKIIIIISVIIIVICSCGIGVKYLYNNKIFPFNQKFELSSTSVNTKIKEGIYITDVSEVVSNVMPSIVSITSKTLINSGYYGPGFNNNSQYVEGAGSGIIISNSNSEILILTNNHVIDDSEELTVKFIDDSEADATVKGVSVSKDIAVISVKVKNLKSDTLSKIKVATLGSSDELKVGNGIIAIGNALGYGQSVTTGVVSALNREVESDSYKNKMIQIDAAINGGNSGGALLNSKGEVVGINSAKYSSSGSSSSASIEGMGFAIPISDVKNIITDLMNGDSSNSDITLGIEGYMTDDLNENISLPNGFYVSSIKSGSYASKSNLKVGYIITKIDDKDVNDVSDITSVLANKKKGDTISLIVKYLYNRSYVEKEIIVNF